MFDFKDLLNQPLPSKFGTYTEDLDTDGLAAGRNDFDGGNAPNSPLTTDPVEIPRTPDVELPNTLSNPTDSTDLTPEEDRRVDDTMNAVATPILMQSEMTESEINEFVESVDGDIAVNEGFLTERTIIKFDKNARRAQLYEVAVAAVAREKKDPLYKKLVTVYKLERTIKAKLRKKYHTQANLKVKQYLKRARQSKSGILARAAAKLSGLFGGKK